MTESKPIFKVKIKGKTVWRPSNIEKDFTEILNYIMSWYDIEKSMMEYFKYWEVVLYPKQNTKEEY